MAFYIWVFLASATGVIIGVRYGIWLERYSWRQRFYHDVEICAACSRRAKVQGHGEGCPVNSLGIK